MNWLKLHHDARNDAKLRLLTDGEHRIWFNLLCFASEQETRGTVDCTDAELLSIEVANGDFDALLSAIGKFKRLRLIIYDDNDILTFPGWMKRQYDRPSDTPEAVRERVTKHRNAKKRNSNEDVTICNALHGDETHGNALDSDSDSEKIIPPLSPQGEDAIICGSSATADPVKEKQVRIQYAGEASILSFENVYPKRDPTDLRKAFKTHPVLLSEIPEVLAIIERRFAGAKLTDAEKSHIPGPGVFIRSKKWQKDDPFEGLTIYRSQQERSAYANGNSANGSRAVTNGGVKASAQSISRYAELMPD